MRFVFAILILLSCNAHAQYKDLNPGESYHDDLLTDDRLVKPQVAPQIPMQIYVPPKPASKTVAAKPVHASRKPASVFEEVSAGGSGGDFQEIAGPHPVKGHVKAPKKNSE